MPGEHTITLDEPSNEDLRLISRRSALRMLGTSGLALMAACATDGVATTLTSATDAPAATAPASVGSTTFGNEGACVLIPEETAGPYPLDLSDEEKFVRSDITEGHPGVPLSLTLGLVDIHTGCQPITDARVDVWHCDADGVYSGYRQPGSDTTGETFCRGIQLPNEAGQVSFQTIFPGWYAGRITHVHFQVFLGSGLAATSQIAFPPEVTDAVYAIEPYSAKGPNTSVRSIADDNVFSDGSAYQTASVTGTADTRLMGALLIGIAA